MSHAVIASNAYYFYTDGDLRCSIRKLETVSGYTFPKGVSWFQYGYYKEYMSSPNAVYEIVEKRNSGFSPELTGDHHRNYGGVYIDTRNCLTRELTIFTNRWHLIIDAVSRLLPLPISEEIIPEIMLDIDVFKPYRGDWWHVEDRYCLSWRCALEH